MTRSQTMAADVTALLRARNPLLWVVTREEARVESYLIEAAASAGYKPYTWDCGQGVADIDGTVVPELRNPDVSAVLATIRARATARLPVTDSNRTAWIMCDLPPWLAGVIGINTVRQIRNLARLLPGAARNTAQAIIILSPKADIPDELAGHATVIDWPLPDRTEITELLDAALESLPDDVKANAAPNGTRNAAIDAAIGLTGLEAQACYAKSLVQLKRIDPTMVAQEKKRIIARERVLEWFDPLPGGLDSVGGLDQLKAWLIQRKLAYSPAAREYGLPAPKGVLLVGISGCGKSLTAKAIGTAWGCPVLRIDLGALKSKFVGESEANLRKALRTIEALGRCVVWCDEIEKALAGASDGAADGGVSKDALGAILSWMQDRQGSAFVVATANDVSGLPPELLRKGRFDEIWWIDLPNRQERAEVVATALRQYGRGDLVGSPASSFNTIATGDVADATEGFTGAEIAALVPDALFAAFADDAREIETDDLLAAAANIKPLSKTAAEKINALRQWSNGRARPATSVEQTQTSARGDRRVLDL